MFSFLRTLLDRKKIVDSYNKPEIKCSNTILLSGPAYGDKTFLGSFLLNINGFDDWMLDHSKSVFSSSKKEQQARLFLPNWVAFDSTTCTNYVTLLDFHMRQVLVPYTYDFYLKGWIKCYCYECSFLHDKLIDNSSEVEKFGKNRSWTEKWLCPNGHILHTKNEELRLLIRRK